MINPAEFPTPAPLVDESPLARLLREYDEELAAGSSLRKSVEERIVGNGGFLGVPDLGPAVTQKVLSRFDQGLPATIVSRPQGIPVEQHHSASEKIIDMVYVDPEGFKDMAVILRRDTPDDERIYIMLLRKAHQHMTSEAGDRVKNYFDGQNYLAVPQSDGGILFEGYLVPIPGTKAGYKGEWGFEPVLTPELLPEDVQRDPRRMENYKRVYGENARKYLLPEKDGADVPMEEFLASADSCMLHY